MSDRAFMGGLFAVCLLIIGASAAAGRRLGEVSPAPGSHHERDGRWRTVADVRDGSTLLKTCDGTTALYLVREAGEARALWGLPGGCDEFGTWLDKPMETRPAQPQVQVGR